MAENDRPNFLCPWLKVSESEVRDDGSMVTTEKMQRCWGHGCALYIKVEGKNPNTGTPENQWGCAMAWTPYFVMDSTVKTNQLGAAIESFRNVFDKRVSQFWERVRAERKKALERQDEG